MTVKDHLQKAHEAIAEHHAAKATHHATMQKHYTKLHKLHKASGMDGGEDVAAIFQDMADAHSKASERHEKDAATHSAMAQECKKALGGVDLEKLADRIVPDQIRGVITEWPGISIQPRTGSPMTPQSTKVEPELEHFTKVEGD